MKTLGISTFAKKTFLCCEHITRYEKYKQLKITLLQLKSGELKINETKELEDSK
jgi:hypothetical protein